MQIGAISNTVIYLVGAAGVGKMTIGKHLAHALNAPLIHNHLWLNPIFGVIDQDGLTPLPAEVWPLTAQVRGAVFQAASSLAPPSWNLIFTHAAVGQSKADDNIANEIIAVARARNARLAVVQLTCSAAVLAERIATPSRRDFMKETDTVAALINAGLPSFAPKAGTIFKLETTGLSAEAAAQEIIRIVKTAPEIAVPEWRIRASMPAFGKWHDCCKRQQWGRKSPKAEWLHPLSQ